ncbi:MULTISPECIES: NAD(P)H-dependent glycerol-3-phosphate dehydrogenase [Halomonadaceae]|jgi:glycerol-3-phosphate dehydrogenase (NAD(P)+)|uniref:NAD(P)H-dependent glycerol-3-phosphate dehydrogenase n=1 Tax=Halomonadaceae TaxID=28256 RepID=UPI0012F22D45|nr:MULTISPECIES: NAD(P)H-dependent glycerol-3-phosphate dehydrogenase [Halomonas]UEQ05899.1 NAD(P)H-dependent glycerol-3-phosphate dehydrogenase [Halomonas profundus]CAD5263228.1 Glycerol-3-phosphate dehydrogenase (NAD(P)+) [Halomonas sp. 156]CAD5264251.1 Glycerol-3-phosphate dehydrogenase (NAD(P)+) [Halomonas sp. I3]CAD5285419.1 Glycerol-3-phosphate dehydrogenase (NAD(P)+) [Halomonas sp. 113]CAD5287007.1 Glycerol-3-phosphate dehydrogenase (NAD(P)+) [Halomonas sp. 59]
MAEQQTNVPVTTNVAVLGGGSFGTALASIAADNGARVRQWMRDETLVTQINQEHRNGRYLPHYAMNPAVEASTDLQAVLADAELVLIAIPSKAFRSVVQAAKAWLRPEQILVSTTKGIEQEGFLLMSQVLEQETGFSHIGVIAGPNLASEIADKQLTATVIASADPLTRTRVQQVLGCRYFRVYASDDRHGVELGGALKNIYAIAAGMAAALGMGENTRSMLMTRALAEMSRFAVAQGANPMTFLGLAGVGDLIVTCSSNLSRNYRVGYAMGEGRTLEEAVDALGQVAEGVNTVKLVCAKASEMGVYMPLAEGLNHVLFDGVPAQEMARTLMMGEQSSDVEFILPREAVQQAHRDQAPHNHASKNQVSKGNGGRNA